MDIKYLVQRCREDILDDVHTDKLWSDAKLTRFAEDAILEACKRAPLIKRAYKIPVVAGTATYAIDHSIRQVLSAQLSLQNYPLSATTEATQDQFAGTFWRTVKDTPYRYIRNKQQITLFPIPVVSDSLVITTTNIPDDSFDLETDIEPAYYQGFVYYMAWKAYNLQDADTINPGKAKENMNLFNEFFGLKHTAKFDIVSQNSPMYATYFGGRMA